VVQTFCNVWYIGHVIKLDVQDMQSLHYNNLSMVRAACWWEYSKQLLYIHRRFDDIAKWLLLGSWWGLFHKVRDKCTGTDVITMILFLVSLSGRELSLSGYVNGQRARLMRIYSLAQGEMQHVIISGQCIAWPMKGHQLILLSSLEIANIMLT